jgi:hypothetical protein
VISRPLALFVDPQGQFTRLADRILTNDRIEPPADKASGQPATSTKPDCDILAVRLNVPVMFLYAGDIGLAVPSGRHNMPGAPGKWARRQIGFGRSFPVCRAANGKGVI